MKTTFHLIIQKDNKQVDMKALDCDYIHAVSYQEALRKVFTEADGWNVFLETIHGEKL